MDWENSSGLEVKIKTDGDKNWKRRLAKLLSAPGINQISYRIPEIWLKNIRDVTDNEFTRNF